MSRDLKVLLRASKVFSIYLEGNRRWVSLERLAQSCETSQLHEKVISVTGH